MADPQLVLVAFVVVSFEAVGYLLASTVASRDEEPIQVGNSVQMKLPPAKVVCSNQYLTVPDDEVLEMVASALSFATLGD